MRRAPFQIRMPPVQPPSDAVVSEADIQAFVDGLLAPDRAAQIQRYLEERPDEARRVAFYGKLNQRMHSTFQHADEGDHPQRATFALCRARLRGWLRHHARRIAVVLLLAGAAATAVLYVMRVPATSLEAGAIMALEQANAMHVPADGRGDAPPLTDAPDLSRAGFRPVAVTTLPVGAFVEARGFVYCNAAGERAVLLSVHDMTAPSQPQWQARRVGGSRVLEWSAGHQRYVLAGGAATHGLMRAADLLASR
jgi:anti-sigma factor RsiW